MKKISTLAISIGCAGPDGAEMVDNAIRILAAAGFQLGKMQEVRRIGDDASLIFRQEYEIPDPDFAEVAATEADARNYKQDANVKADQPETEAAEECDCFVCNLRRKIEAEAEREGSPGIRIVRLML